MNKAILQGNIGRDPKISYTPGGKKVANASLATTKYKSNGQGGFDEFTEWHNLVAWGANADKFEQLGKGDSILVEGELQTRRWDDKDGNKKSITEIVVFYCRVMRRNSPPQQTQQPGGYGQDPQY